MIETIDDMAIEASECDEAQIDFDCSECGNHFCTEDPEHKAHKDGMCGYCSALGA